MSGPSTQADALAAFARRERVLVALDFDGTLAPIVPDPADARPLPAAVHAVRALAALPRTHLAVVSGRPLVQLRGLVRPLGAVALVGSHGAEIGASPPGDGADGVDGGPASPLDDDQRRLLARVRAALADVTAAHPGTTLEDKPAAVVLHTRRAGRAAALAATAEALEGPARWAGVHPLRGKEVVELAVTDVSKGTALRRLRAGLGLGRGGVLFAGDDTTDERAFAVLDDDAGDVTVKVGDGATGARHRVRDPEALADVLARLAAARGQA